MGFPSIIYHLVRDQKSELNTELNMTELLFYANFVEDGEENKENHTVQNYIWR